MKFMAYPKIKGSSAYSFPDPPASQDQLVQLVQAKEQLWEVRREGPVGPPGFATADVERQWFHGGLTNKHSGIYWGYHGGGNIVGISPTHQASRQAVL